MRGELIALLFVLLAVSVVLNILTLNTLKGEDVHEAGVYREDCSVRIGFTGSYIQSASPSCAYQLIDDCSPRTFGDSKDVFLQGKCGFSDD